MAGHKTHAPRGQVVLVLRNPASIVELGLVMRPMHPGLVWAGHETHAPRIGEAGPETHAPRVVLSLS